MKNQKSLFKNSKKTHLNKNTTNLTEKTFSRKNLIATLIILTSIIACSAATLIVTNVSQNTAKADIEWFNESEDGYTTEPALLSLEETALEKAETTSTTTSTTSTTTTTTTSTTTTMTTTTTTSTSTTTSTTEPCGGDLQKPCKAGTEGINKDGCEIGNVRGADGICHTPTCAPSVESGKKGCGAWALKFCRTGTYDPKKEITKDLYTRFTGESDDE